MKARKVFSVRLHTSTLKDLDLIAKRGFNGNRAQALRFILRKGFQSLGPRWRIETWIFENPMP